MAASAAAPLVEAGGTVRIVTTEGGQIRTTWPDVMVDLAQINDQSTGTSARWAEEISVGERVLAFVHSSNSQLLSSLTAMARSGSEIAAVVFEGFMPGDDAAFAVNSLTAVGINAISCRSVELSKAIQIMEFGVGSGGVTTVAPVPDVEPATNES
jgi:hypothetical protein